MLGVSFDALKQRDRRRRIRRTILATASSVAVAAALGTTAYYAFGQQRIAQARNLAAESIRVGDQDPPEALRLAIQAGALSPTTESAAALPMRLPPS